MAGKTRRKKKDAGQAKVRPAWAVRLEAARTLKGVNKKKFAEQLGLEPETYRRYERGETEPNFQTLRRIRDIAGISLDVLIAGETFHSRDRLTVVGR